MKTDTVQPFDYHETAYDSTRPRELPVPIKNSNRGLMARAWLAHKLPSLPVACAEFVALDGIDDMDMLRTGALDIKAMESPLQIKWGTFQNPLGWVEMFRVLAAIVGIGSFFVSFLLWLAYDPSIHATQQNGARALFYIALAGAGLYLLLGYVKEKGLVPDINYIVLDRISGMVRDPLGGGRYREIPFDELAPYLHKVISTHGLVTYGLIVGHQYSDIHLMRGGHYTDARMVHLQWEFYRQFMDVSQPLPDVPALEPHRPYDPTTVEWDKRMGRPPDFWRNYPLDDYLDLRIPSAETSQRFYWGLTRQQALYRGWQPTCYSEMTWWGAPALKSDEDKVRHWQRCLGAGTDKQERQKQHRAQRFELLLSLYDAAYEARKTSHTMAKALLENYELSPEDKEQFVTYVEDSGKSLEILFTAKQSVEKAGPDETISGQVSDPAYLHTVWIKEIVNQASIQELVADYEHLGDFEKQRTEHMRVHFEAIVTAINTLKHWEFWHYEFVPHGVQDIFKAFMVNLVAKASNLDQREVSRLNRTFSQGLTGEEYIALYAEKVDKDKASKALISLLIQLRDFNKQLAGEVNRLVEMLIEDMVNADGVYDEHEWERIAKYRQLTSEALGIDIPLPKRPGEVMD